MDLIPQLNANVNVNCPSPSLAFLPLFWPSTPRPSCRLFGSLPIPCLPAATLPKPCLSPHIPPQALAQHPNLTPAFIKERLAPSALRVLSANAGEVGYLLDQDSLPVAELPSGSSE